MGQWDPNTGTFGNEMNPYIKANQSGIMGLGGYSVQNTPSDQWEQTIGGQNPYEQILNPQIQKPHTGITRQPPPQGGWNQLPQGPPRQDIFGIRGMGEQIGGFGEQLGGFGEQMGGFGEQLGGYKDLLSGFGEKFGGFGEQLGGFKDEFSGINDKLQNLEQGISSLTDKFGTQQQQSPYQQNFGMNPFGSINPYTPFFGGLGAFMRRY